MFAPSARSAVVAAAIALTGTAALGQQVANVNKLPDRADYIAAACNHITNPTERTGCVGAASLRYSEESIAASDRGIAEV